MITKYWVALALLAPLVLLWPILAYSGAVSEAKRLDASRITLDIRWNDKAKYQWFLYNEVGGNYADFKALSRLIDCESGWRADAKSHTQDVGLLQIHLPAHLKRAEGLGLDIVNSWEDNLKFGVILYREQGVSPWVCSLLQ